MGRLGNDEEEAEMYVGAGRTVPAELLAAAAVQCAVTVDVLCGTYALAVGAGDQCYGDDLQ